MHVMVRRLRGLLGVGITWGVLWATIGTIVGFVLGVVAPESGGWTGRITDWMIGLGLYGLVSGVGFGAFLALRERNRTISDISLGRAAVWGVIGAALAPLVFLGLGAFPPGTTTAAVVGAIAVTASLGGAVAPAALVIARRAELTAKEESDGARLQPADDDTSVVSRVPIGESPLSLPGDS